MKMREDMKIGIAHQNGMGTDTAHHLEPRRVGGDAECEIGVESILLLSESLVGTGN